MTTESGIGLGVAAGVVFAGLAVLGGKRSKKNMKRRNKRKFTQIYKKLNKTRRIRKTKKKVKKIRRIRKTKKEIRK